MKCLQNPILPITPSPVENPSRVHRHSTVQGALGAREVLGGGVQSLAADLVVEERWRSEVFAGGGGGEAGGVRDEVLLEDPKVFEAVVVVKPWLHSKQLQSFAPSSAISQPIW